MKLIIFDIDGTLVYSERRDSQLFAAAYLDVFKQSLPTIDWSYYPNVTDTVIFEHIFKTQFGRNPTMDDLQTFQENYINRLKINRKETPNQSKEVPNATNMIHRLYEMKGYQVGIATGGWKRPAQLKLRHIGINPLPKYDGYADFNYSREAIINDALNLAQKDFEKIEKVVYVGDAAWDVSTTRNMNIPLIGVRWRGDFEVLQDLGAKQIIKNYNDFDLFLEMIERAEVPD